MKLIESCAPLAQALWKSCRARWRTLWKAGDIIIDSVLSACKSWLDVRYSGHRWLPADKNEHDEERPVTCSTRRDVTKGADAQASFA